MVRKKITDLLGSELANLQSPMEPKLQIPAIETNEPPLEQENEATNLQSSEQTDSQASRITNSSTSEQLDSEALEMNAIERSLNSDNTSNLQSSRVTNIQSLKHTESESLEVPKYLQLERKEVRLRLDQLDSLTTLIRRLNRARKGKGERLTENTLIRVAIDLLLKNTNQLQGITEDELLASLGLLPSDSR